MGIGPLLSNINLKVLIWFIELILLDNYGVIYGKRKTSGSNKNPVGYIKDSGMCHVENYTILTFKAWELSYDYWVSSILKTGIWNVL